jgi:hypothetical protein
MSGTSRRLARRKLPRQQIVELEIDEERTERVDLLGSKLVVATQNLSALVGQTASALGMSRDDAGDLIDRYVEETEGNGHPQGFMPWIAGEINKLYDRAPVQAAQTHVVEEAETDTTITSSPELTLVIKHPPAWCAHDAVANGAKVTMTMTMQPDTAETRRFPMHAEMPEGATEGDLRAVIGMSLDYLCLTWALHGRLLEVFRGSQDWGRPEPTELDVS